MSQFFYLYYLHPKLAYLCVLLISSHKLKIHLRVIFLLQVLAATQTPGEQGKKWFQGTADAVRQFHWLFEVQANHKICDVTYSLIQVMLFNIMGQELTKCWLSVKCDDVKICFSCCRMQGARISRMS